MSLKLCLASSLDRKSEKTVGLLWSMVSISGLSLFSSCSGFASVYPSAFAAWFAAFWTSVEIVAIFFCEANQIHCHKASLQSDWCTTIVARRYKSMILRSPDPYTDAKGRARLTTAWAAHWMYKPGHGWWFKLYCEFRWFDQWFTPKPKWCQWE